MEEQQEQEENKETIELKELCKKLADIRKSGIITIILPKEDLGFQHFGEIYKLISENKCKHLSIILLCFGGDIHTAYRIIEFLRSHCNYMTTIIPMFAKSAATLFILASDEIVMGELAELGPLDTQILVIEKGEKKYTSALNPFKSLEELLLFSTQALDLTVKLCLARAYLSIDEALKHSIDFVGRISAPLFSQLKPDKIGENSRALAVAKEYGERLLRRYSKWDKMEEREKILDLLVTGYPSHDYIIDYKELNDIGFNVTLPSKEEKQILEKIMKYIAEFPQTAIIFINEANRSKNIKKAKSNKRGK